MPQVVARSEKGHTRREAGSESQRVLSVQDSRVATREKQSNPAFFIGAVKQKPRSRPCAERN